MIRISVIAIMSALAMVVGDLYAATLQVASSSVIVVAGQTIEVPLHSDKSIAPDLAAWGAFDPSDVSIMAGPGCHLSANGCTLLIKASPNSKRYTAVPVVVRESAASNTPIFALSVIYPGEPEPTYTPLPNIDPMSLLPPHQIQPKTIAPSSVIQQVQQPKLQRSGNPLFYALAEPHPGLMMAQAEDNDFTADTNGPVYQIVKLTNNHVAQPLSVTITGSGASSFSFDEEASHYGSKKNCAAMISIASGDTCLVIIKAKVGDPRKPPEKAMLTIKGGDGDIATFTLLDTTYVYAAGGFNTLGNATVSGGSLLAQCTAGTCSNALQGTTGNNYAATNLSVGQWINALAVTPAGHLMVGGVFGEIGGATSGATSGTAALLAQCTPGAVDGNACINQINQTGSLTNAFAFSNAYIDAITVPFAISSSNFIALGGDFTNIRAFAAASSGRMLAKCAYNGTSANQTCNSYIGSGTTTNKYANNAITTLSTLGSTSSVPKVSAGGLFTQIAAYPSSAPSVGTTFAACSSGTSGSCSQGMGSDNPNSSILGMTDDGTNLYMGGAFTQIGGYTDSSGGYPLVQCTPATTTTCVNALSGSHDANGYIEGLVYSGGNLYVGGRFTTIGGATSVSSGNMLAVCTPGGSCSNFVTDAQDYASGSDWGGGIFAVAVGTQTNITAN